MNELQDFTNNQFGIVRVVIKGEEPWFIAADVCKCLEIANSRDAIKRLDEDERDVVLTDTLGGKQKMSIISESGLYSLTLGSRKQSAKEFKRWITHDVIPSIRKHDGENVKNLNKNDVELVTYDGDKITVSGRELHKVLEVKTQYKDWFPRMCEYGFSEGTDFSSILSESTGGRPRTDHQLTIDMAKELCMIQRNEKGKQFRQYFIQVEKNWNNPEAIMARALQMSNQTLTHVRQQNTLLIEEIGQLKPKADYADNCLIAENGITVTSIAKEYGMSARAFNKLLHDKGIQYKVGRQWVLYADYQDKGYTITRTVPIGLDGDDPQAVPQTLWTQKGKEFLYTMLKSEVLGERSAM